MKAKMIYTCLFLMVMFTANYVRGQTTTASVYQFDYGLLYPAPNDPRPTGSVTPNVKWEKRTGKIAYSVRADSVELDSLCYGYQRAWSLEVLRIVSNTRNGYSDSVQFRRKVTTNTGVVTYKDTTIFIYRNKILLTDIWPGIDIMFYDGDSMAVRDIMLIYLINRKFVKITPDGYSYVMPVYYSDTLTIADYDTLRGKKDTIYTRPFQVTNMIPVDIFIDMTPITSTGDTVRLAVQGKPKGATSWYGGAGGKVRLLALAAFNDTTWAMKVPADSLMGDSVRFAQIGAVTKGRNIIKRLRVRFWK